jgi:hypothetical protein
MTNPWLSIPLEDYEGHMSAPEVLQLGALSDLFAETLGRLRPSSVAILGIAGGNGLDRIDTGITERVVGLDVNPLYLEEVRSRYGAKVALELHCVDLARERIACDPVKLVHAALVFEHAGVELCLENAVALVDEGGALSVVLQLPGDGAANVAASPYSTMQKLREGFALVDCGELSQSLAQHGFRLEYEARRLLPGGKSFWLGVFLRVLRQLHAHIG